MFIFEKKPKAMVSEAYRNLRTNIQYSSLDDKLKVILVTSSKPGEGKSTTAGNLSLSLSEDSKKVLLIDCDLRKPTMHKKFNISNASGISEVLVGKKTVAEAINKYKENLHIITSGKIPPNPTEMLGSKTMERLLKELKESYDYIILDCAPVLAGADSQVLSTKVDGTILVVKAETTKIDEVVDCKEALEKVNANIIGTVFTGVKNKNERYYQYYGEE